MDIRMRLVPLLAAALALVGGSARAQDSDALLRVQERAQYLNDYKALLQHSDSSVRLAAVDEALRGDDAALRTLALETSLDSDDERLQTAALRWLLDERDNLVVEIILPDAAEPAQEYAYQQWHGLVLQEVGINAKTDEITLRDRRFRAGQLVRGGFELSFRVTGSRCTLQARVAGGTLLTGAMSCVYVGGAERNAGGARASVPIRIDLS